MTANFAKVVIVFGAIVVLGAPNAHALKLVEQKPIFDTSVLPKRSRFELGVKQSELLDPRGAGVALRAKADDSILKLRTGTNGGMLRGGVTETEVRTSIETRERAVKGRFGLDLFALIPKIAPDLALSLEAVRNQAQKKLAGQVAQQEREMKLQAQAPRTAPVMPLAPKGGVSDPKLIGELERERSKTALPQQSRMPAVDLTAAAERANARVAIMPGGPMSGAGVAMPGRPVAGAGPQMPDARTAMRAQLTPALQDAEKAMQGQLQGKKRPLVDMSVDAQLRAARENMNRIAKEAEPELRAITTQIRRLPNAPDAVSPLSADPLLMEQVGNRTISWDSWHANFAKLAGELLLKNVNTVGGPVGANTISITVTVDHRVTTALARRGNAAFDKAVLQSYQALNGNSALTFPSGSLRKSVSFLVDNKHDSAGNAAVVNSVTSVGDKEVQRRAH